MSGPDLDLAACSAEPIRIPGAIQPHGALLVIDGQSLSPLHASANLADIVGAPPPAGPLDGDAAWAELAHEVGRWRESGEPSLLKLVAIGDRRLQVVGRAGPQGVLLELEAPAHPEPEGLEGLHPRLGRFLQAIGRARSLGQIAQTTAAEIRALTGFDRVLLYSFDETGDGEVLAEDANGRLPSYLGHRFPASDIPVQARELYVLNRLRLIPDADYRPSPVEPAISPVDGRPLDLSWADLRSVSPVHLEYMRNMGTLASMSISIVVEGRLWGLISAHHHAPKGLGVLARTACDILGQVLSLHIEAREQAERTRDRLRLKEIETALLAQLGSSDDFRRDLGRAADLWLALADAEGAAVISQDQVRAVGSTPPEDAIRDIARRLGEAGEEIGVTESMSEIWPEARPFASEASGLLAVSISRIHPNYLLWFRREAVRTIRWAGDPTKAVAAGSERLHPRKSFELWREQVRERSLPWSPTAIESARSFGASITSLVLRRAEERAELTDRLERANRELESFSYSISHDLRAPFRHIVGYSELLQERATQLDAKSRHYLDSIKDAALGAGRLVDDLLTFSQLGRSELTFTNVDMDKLLAEAVRSLEVDVRNRNLEWRIGRLPLAWGDPGMLRQVWKNLLENALKYTRPRDRAIIEINGRAHEETVEYSVRDNGVGFDMAYAGKLFGVFQRLHSPDEFEGAGIGLAFVKRIVNRHGGEVSALGEPGHGATFRFTLPGPPRSTSMQARPA